jgi:hypothetical protein
MAQKAAKEEAISKKDAKRAKRAKRDRATA